MDAEDAYPHLHGEQRLPLGPNEAVCRVQGLCVDGRRSIETIHKNLIRNDTLLIISTLSATTVVFNPLTAGAEYIQVFTFYWHIKYQILIMLKIKCDINQQDLKRVYLHFVKSE